MMPASTKPVVYFPRVLSPLSLLSPATTPTSSLTLPPSPPVCNDILSTLYLGGLPRATERIFSFLNPADLCSSLQVCTTWNHLVSTDAQFMNKVNIYHRRCKENAENLHKTKEPAETTVPPVKRKPLTAFTPNTQSQFQSTKAVSPVPFAVECIKPWHEEDGTGRVNPSKRPRQSEAICGTKRRLRRLWTQIQPTSLKYTTSAVWMQDTPSPLLCHLLWRTQPVHECVHSTLLKIRLSWSITLFSVVLPCCWKVISL